LIGRVRPNCVLALKLADQVHNFKIEIRAEGGGIQHTVTPTEKDPSKEVEKIAALLGSADLLKVFYDLLHFYPREQGRRKATDKCGHLLTILDMTVFLADLHILKATD
jgi:hypothetical protein